MTLKCLDHIQMRVNGLNSLMEIGIGRILRRDLRRSTFRLQLTLAILLAFLLLEAFLHLFFLLLLDC